MPEPNAHEVSKKLVLQSLRVLSIIAHHMFNDDLEMIRDFINEYLKQRDAGREPEHSTRMRLQWAQDDEI